MEHDLFRKPLHTFRDHALVPPRRLRRPDFLVARHLAVGDHLADAGDVHQVLVVEVLRDRIAAPGAAAERRGRSKAVGQRPAGGERGGLVHNHPGGDPTPSRADIEMTRQIVEIARGLGIAVHDHIIVGRDGHTSMKGLRLI
jgi:hypothetical protein